MNTQKELLNSIKASIKKGLEVSFINDKKGIVVSVSKRLSDGGTRCISNIILEQEMELSNNSILIETIDTSTKNILSLPE